MSLKKSRKMNPFRVLQRGPLWRELSVSRVFFYMSLEFLITFLINRNYTLLSKALGKECPPMFPKTGTLWKQTSIYRTLHSIFFEVRSKGALPPGSPHRAPTERERERERCSVSRTLLHSSFTVPAKWAPFHVLHVVRFSSMRQDGRISESQAHIQQSKCNEAQTSASYVNA